jgi:hypothetical protein
MQNKKAQTLLPGSGAFAADGMITSTESFPPKSAGLL